MVERKGASKTGDDFVYVDTYNAPEFYADGLSGILVGFPTLKLSFHTVLASGNSELRRNCAVITMDVHSAIDMAFDILDSCKENEEQLLHMASKGIPARLKDLLNKIPAEQVELAANPAPRVRGKAKAKE